MKELLNTRKFKLLSGIYILIVLLLTFIVHFDFNQLEYLLRISSIPFLMFIYYKTSVIRNNFYLLSLSAAAISNVLFISNDTNLLNYGLILFLIYRIITIFLVIKASSKLSFFTVLVGSVFFLFPLSYFIVLTQDSLGESFYVALINVILISVLGGLSLSNYLIEEGFKHTWLLLSTLLYTFLVFLFVIQKYYLFISIFEPIRVLVLMAAHYFFCLYVLLSEMTVKKSNHY